VFWGLYYHLHSVINLRAEHSDLELHWDVLKPSHVLCWHLQKIWHSEVVYFFLYYVCKLSTQLKVKEVLYYNFINYVGMLFSGLKLSFGLHAIVLFMLSVLKLLGFTTLNDYGICLACARPWIWCPALKKKIKNHMDYWSIWPTSS
jgi:hypothetical protein